MIRIEARGFAEAQRAFRQLSKDAPDALVKALNYTGDFDVKPALVNGMRAAFDRPTRWTLNSVFLDRATVERPVATVHFKDRLGAGVVGTTKGVPSKGVPAGRFLRPQILGGPRAMKSHERALAKMGLLPGDVRLVPAAGADVDADGNVAPHQLKAIVKALRPASAGRKRRTKRGAVVAAPRYFVIPPGQKVGGLGPGIYLRMTGPSGGFVVPVLAYARGVTYQPRFDFAGIGARAVAEGLPPRLRRALDRLLRAPGAAP